MAANSFMSGFTGGMNAMNNMLDSQMRRDTLKQQQEDQEALRTFSSMMHLYNSMDAEQKKGFQQSVVDELNADPGVQQILSRNVGHDEQKRISSRFGEMVGDRFVPFVDVVNGKTGEVLRTAPLTEFGTSDPDDPPVGISRQDFMTTMGKFAGKDSFGRRIGAQILQHGGTLPESPEQFELIQHGNALLQKGSKSGYSYLGSSGSGSGTSKPKLETTLKDDKTNNTIQIWREGDQVYARHFSPEGKLGLVENITGKWNNDKSGGSTVEDTYKDQYYGTPSPTQTQNEPGTGVLKPEHLSAGMVPKNKPSPSSSETPKETVVKKVSEEDLQKQKEIKEKYSSETARVIENSKKIKEIREGGKAAREKYLNSPLPIGYEEHERGIRK